ncbi:hypothetical protein OIU78_007991 [Salix suchowensis]|nr:hypothetical protein OIU78_007991 [Salix suchowensis]
MGSSTPIFLTLCHMMACSLFSYIAISWLKIVPLQTMRSRSQFLKISGLGIIFCSSVVAGNISLRYLPVSFNQAIGATTPFFTAVFAYLMTLRREGWLTYVSLVPVVAGCVIASGGEPSFNLFGLLMCIGATAARALKTVGLNGHDLIISRCYQGKTPFYEMNLLMYMAPVAVAVLVPAAYFMEGDVVLGNAKGAVAVVISIFDIPESGITVAGVVLYNEARKRSRND